MTNFYCKSRFKTELNFNVSIVNFRTWITGLSDVIAVFAAITGSAQACVTVLRGRFLADTTVVAGILGADLTVCDSYAIGLIADQINLLLADDQSTDTPDKARGRLSLIIDLAVARHSTDIERLFEVQTLASAHRNHLVRSLAIH